MLELAPGLVVLVARACAPCGISADDVAVPFDEDVGVVAVTVERQLGVPETESDTESFRLIEERLGDRARHLGFVVTVELGRVAGDAGLVALVEEPAGEERGEREFWEDDQLTAVVGAVAQEGEESFDDRVAIFVARDRPQLGGTYLDGIVPSELPRDQVEHDVGAARSRRLRDLRAR